MDSLTLIDKKEQLKIKAESILSGAEKEQRKLTEDEQREFDDLKDKIVALEDEIKEINACLNK
jgi:hypothetical protein